MRNKPNIAVLGDGGWGTTLSIHLFNKGYPVTLWGAFKENVNYINKKHVNKKFLPGIRIPTGIKITADLKQATLNKKIIVLAVPSQYLRQVLKQLKTINYPKEAIYLSVTKGIETSSLKRISEVFHSELGNLKFAVLSGPTIAYEVAKGVPTTAVIASHDLQSRKYLQEIFITDKFRVYTN